MLLRGRGVTTGEEKRPWRFLLEERQGRLTGELQADGWSGSFKMNAWFEKHAGKEVELGLEGFGRALLTPKGLRTHETGHHSESSVKVEGSLPLRDGPKV
ncbi:MAG TPA: hypothetical protein PK877_07085 [Synergistales bacterium]|nr:hypothetical protein [Synergistales bacterium]